MPRAPRYEAGKEFRVTEAFPDDFFDGLSVPSLVVKPGDRVTLTGEKGSGTWPTFVLVVDERGQRGWIPRDVLETGEGSATVTRRYDTTTLDPEPGEVLQVIEPDVENGWLWCRNAKGELGWFPINRLEPVRR
jgi:hypothetical protein